MAGERSVPVITWGCSGLWRFTRWKSSGRGEAHGPPAVGPTAASGGADSPPVKQNVFGKAGLEMQDNQQRTLQALPGRNLFALRLLTGIFQGVALYMLMNAAHHRSGIASIPALFD